GGRRTSRRAARRLSGRRGGVWLGPARPARGSIAVCPRPQSAAPDLLHLVLSRGVGGYGRGRRLRPTRSARPGGLMQGFSPRVMGTPGVALSLIWLAFIVVVAMAAPWLAPGSPFAIVAKPFAPPFGDFLLGTDSLGRSLLAGLIHGARTSLMIAILATLSAVVF